MPEKKPGAADNVARVLLEVLLRVQGADDAVRDIRRAAGDAWSAVVAGHKVDNFTETRLREGLLRLCNVAQSLAPLRGRVGMAVDKWNKSVGSE